VEVRLDGPPLDVTDRFKRERAAVPLELGLMRLEDVGDERAGPVAELELVGGEGQVHAAQCGGHGSKARAGVAGRGTLL
jgi:hypothetical protein